VEQAVLGGPAEPAGDRLRQVARIGRGGVADRARHCDANWTNAVRTTLKGRDHIVDYSRRLFADPRFAAGWLVGEPHLALRWLGADIVVAMTYVERGGTRRRREACCPCAERTQ
jgi:hypothetical protein